MKTLYTPVPCCMAQHGFMVDDSSGETTGVLADTWVSQLCVRASWYVVVCHSRAVGLFLVLLHFAMHFAGP